MTPKYFEHVKRKDGLENLILSGYIKKERAEEKNEYLSYCFCVNTPQSMKERL